MNEPTRIALMDEFPDFGAKGFDVNAYNQRFLRANTIILAKSKRIAFPSHWGALSVKCAFAGTEFYKSLNSLYAVNEDNYLLFNEGKVYSSWIEADREVESFTLSITPKFEKEVLYTILSPADALLDSPDVIIDHKFRFTEKLYSHDQSVSHVLLEIYRLCDTVSANGTTLNELFTVLLERLVSRQTNTNFEIDAVNKLRPATRIELFERLTRAKDFMYSSYNHDLGLCDIADIACLNQFYFLRQFKKVFHVTPHQFLTRRRLEVASQLLAGSNRSITEICSDVGFSDIASFSKLFKKDRGIPPLQYRKNIGATGRREYLNKVSANVSD